MEHLYELRDSPAFATYRKLLRGGIEATMLQLNQVRATSEDMASHNHLVGFIEATRRADMLVESLIAAHEHDTPPRRAT
jgi:hypothetical protein